MDTVSNIKIRRSIRKYKEDAIPHSLIEEVVETARFAPSWKNTQIVRYVCVEDPVRNNRLQTTVQWDLHITRILSVVRRH